MKKQNGFTIIELMVTVAVGFILATIAVPAFQEMIQNNRVTSESRNIASAFNLARGEAVTRGNTVTVCTSNNGTACNGTGNWVNGWLVFSDRDGDGVVDGNNCAATTTNDCVIKMWDGNDNLNMTSNPTPTPFVSFNADSRATAQLDVFVLPNGCDTGDQRQKRVRVTTTGQVSVAKTACP